jgi:hypothetical protein
MKKVLQHVQMSRTCEISVRVSSSDTALCRSAAPYPAPPALFPLLQACLSARTLLLGFAPTDCRACSKHAAVPASPCAASPHWELQALSLASIRQPHPKLMRLQRLPVPRLSSGPRESGPGMVPRGGGGAGRGGRGKCCAGGVRAQ